MNIKQIFSAHDMTEGAPWQRLAEFAFPMLLGNLAQQLYNTVDSIVVGNYIGDDALAAVGSASPILNLLLALFVGISTGAGIVVSQYYGANDREKLSECIGNCVTLGAIASLASMAIGTLIARPLLELLNTDPTIIDWCADYLIVFFLGAVGFTFYNILSGILRGMGDSFSALVFLIIATVLNIFMDVWFVAGPLQMGVPGVALATVLAQGISAALCFVKLLFMRDVFDLTFRSLRLTRRSALRIIRIGIPSGITQAIMSVAMLVVQSLTNSMGKMVITANVMIMRVDGFAMMPNFSFGQALSVYTGQNVGAGRLDRVPSGRRQGAVMAVGFSCVVTLAILIFGRNLFHIFSDTAEIITLASRMMAIMAAGYIAVAFSQVLGGVMRGAGDTMTPMWISLVTTVAMRVPLAYVLAWMSRSAEWPNGRPEALSLSLLISWLAGALISYVAYRHGKWRQIAVAAASEKQAA